MDRISNSASATSPTGNRSKVSGPARDESIRLQAQTQLHRERRRQIRGLVFLAIAALFFAIFRAGVHRVFTPGWWRLW